MTQEQGDTGVEVEAVVEKANFGDKANQAHIVKVALGQNAQAVVLAARIEGLFVVALCGWRWIPARDPQQLPVCAECAEIYELYRMGGDGLRERPGM